MTEKMNFFIIFTARIQKTTMTIIKFYTIFLMLSNVTGYNYYEMAFQNWCNNSYISIHGLWPQISNKSYPEYCSNISYYTPPNSIYLPMLKYWNNCDNTTAFWIHEWDKHGTCYQQQTNTNETTYFETGLSIYFNNINYISKICTLTATNCKICLDLNYNVINC